MVDLCFAFVIQQIIFRVDECAWVETFSLKLYEYRSKELCIEFYSPWIIEKLTDQLVNFWLMTTSSSDDESIRQCDALTSLDRWLHFYCLHFVEHRDFHTKLNKHFTIHIINYIARALDLRPTQRRATGVGQEDCWPNSSIVLADNYARYKLVVPRNRKCLLTESLFAGPISSFRGRISLTKIFIACEYWRRLT